ncbi:hypothetical protein N0V90_008526 [Kalmusia sp. IMI 367209]|nr:hypothetical protein N0V90_008526 [Kalmusia sp. IMI 367209]
MVDVDPRLKRLQQDLLILTSLPDNSSLAWRPSWFTVPTFALNLWTLHNPPHVITEELPKNGALGRQVMTRRMRRKGDREPMWIKTQMQWEKYCDMPGEGRSWEALHTADMATISGAT